MTNTKIASSLLRLGLSFAFLYAAVFSFLDPYSWIGFLPSEIKIIISPFIFLKIFSVYEILLAGWFLSGFKTSWAALLGSATMLGIIIPNLGSLDITFRDIALFFSALALIFISRSENQTN